MAFVAIGARAWCYKFKSINDEGRLIEYYAK